MSQTSNQDLFNALSQLANTQQGYGQPTSQQQLLQMLQNANTNAGQASQQAAVNYSASQGQDAARRFASSTSTSNGLDAYFSRLQMASTGSVAGQAQQGQAHALEQQAMQQQHSQQQQQQQQKQQQQQQ